MPNHTKFSNQSGFSQLVLLIPILVIVLLSVAFYFYYQYIGRTEVLSASIPVTMSIGQTKKVTCSGDRVSLTRLNTSTITLNCTSNRKGSFSFSGLFSSPYTTDSRQTIPVTCLNGRMDAERLSSAYVNLLCNELSTTPPASTCGDGVCDTNETEKTCKADCSVVVPPPEIGGVGLPFGPYHLPTANYGKETPVKFTGGFLGLEKMDVAAATSALETAKSNGMKLIVSTTGGGGAYSDSSGNYSYSLFQSTANNLRGLDLEKYYKEGVVVGNLIMDEPQDASNWNGTALTIAQVKEAATYIKTIWPTVPVGIGSNPTFLKSGTWSSKDVDFVSYPFTTRKLCAMSSRVGCYGTTKEELMVNLVAEAKAAKLGLSMSINPFAGGTPMSPSDLQMYAESFSKNDLGYLCALTVWRWDSPDANADGKDYFVESQNAGVTAALNNVLTTNTTHTSNVSCKLH